jgi:hypothetical protein
MLPEQDRKRLDDFVAGRIGWKVHEREGRTYAGRSFVYAGRGSCRALLSVQKVADRGRLSWVAQVNIPFAAGPEDHLNSTFEACVGWTNQTEAVLVVPTHLCDCKTAEQARELLGKLRTGRELVLVCAVLDIDPMASRQSMREMIARRCLSPDAVSGLESWLEVTV